MEWGRYRPKNWRFSRGRHAGAAGQNAEPGSPSLAAESQDGEIDSKRINRLADALVSDGIHVSGIDGVTVYKGSDLVRSAISELSGSNTTLEPGRLGNIIGIFRSRKPLNDPGAPDNNMQTKTRIPPRRRSNR